MPTYKQTIYFESGDEEGWSEHYYLDATDLPSADPILTQLIQLLLPMRSPHWGITYAVTSDPTVRGSSFPHQANYPLAGTYAMQTGEFDLEANCAILVQEIDIANFKNHFFLRGLTTAKIQGREIHPALAWDNAFTAFKNFVLAQGYSCRHKVKGSVPARYTYSPIADLQIVRATARKPGRPFGVVRGRRSKRP